MDWRGLGRSPGGQEPAFSGVGVVCERTWGRISRCGQVCQVQEGKWRRRLGLRPLLKTWAKDLGSEWSGWPYFIGERESGLQPELTGLSGVCKCAGSKSGEMGRKNELLW